LLLLIRVKRIYLKKSSPSVDSKNPGRNKFLLTEFENLVRKNYPTVRTVNDYAHLLHVTPKYLSDALKKESGKTAQQIFQDILMLEAKSLLLQTDMPIGELSHRLGFVDPSYFSKMFKANNGMTPAAFRKKR
jgi:AraC family transcriptional activator of pobA